MARNEVELKTLREIANKVGEVDPMGMVIMAAAGGAGLCGIPGPLTKILLAFTGKDGVTSNDNQLLKGILEIGGIVTIGPGVIDIWNALTGSSGASTDQKVANVELLGMGFSNIVEAGIMYSLVKNPETFKLLGDMAKIAANKIPALPTIPV